MQVKLLAPKATLAQYEGAQRLWAMPRNALKMPNETGISNELRRRLGRD